MINLHLNESELGKRWGLSPKTLQRWRTENRGPAYLKLSKRVTYAMEDIVAYEASQKRVCENSHAFAVQNVANPVSTEALNSSVQADTQAGMGEPTDSAFITDAEAARDEAAKVLLHRPGQACRDGNSALPRWQACAIQTGGNSPVGGTQNPAVRDQAERHGSNCRHIPKCKVEIRGTRTGKHGQRASRHRAVKNDTQRSLAPQKQRRSAGLNASRQMTIAKN